MATCPAQHGDVVGSVREQLGEVYIRLLVEIAHAPHQEGEDRSGKVRPAIVKRAVIPSERESATDHMAFFHFGRQDQALLLLSLPSEAS